MLRLLILCLTALFVAAPAQAQWRQATTRHFIIYSDGSEKDLAQWAERLERHQHIVRTMSRLEQASVPIKAKVYLLRNIDAVEQIAGPGVGGFYFATPRGPIAVAARRLPTRMQTERTRIQSTEGVGEEILQHELTHHFMYQYFPTNYPTWYSEGFAEFYGSIAFRDGNIAELGHPPGFRIDQIKEDWLPVSKLLTVKKYDDVKDRIGALYAQGWLMVHYAFNNPARGRQLNQYLRLASSGTPYADAAKQAFGDLGTLDRELRDYFRAGIKALRLPLKDIDTGPITIRPLTDLESRLLRSDMFLNFGIPVKDADDIARNVAREVGNSTDPYGLRILTEAHRAAEQHDQATAAVARWLAAHPNDPKALMHKGALEIERLRAAKSTDQAAWDRARDAILRANKLAPTDPEILVAYYDSFQAQGVLPPPPAVTALFGAFKLVPQDPNLRQRLAMDYENRGMIQEAIVVIQPAANSMHEDDPKREARRRRLWEKNRVAGQSFMESARKMLERLEKKLADQKAAAPRPVGNTN